MDILEISMDSAYRRLRSETALSIEEIYKLCRHYNISFDSISETDAGSVTFRYQPVEGSVEEMMEYLGNLNKNLENLAKLKNSQVVYACRDIPLFYHFKFPMLASFKMYYWIKSIMNVPSFQSVKFDVDVISPEIQEIGKRIAEAYIKIPSTEIWTDGILDSFLKQIEYAFEAGFFKNTEQAIEICNLLVEELNSIKTQAEIKAKFTDEARKFENTDNFELYMSEIEIGNNTILVKAGDFSSVFITHHSFNNMQTSNAGFVRETDVWINSLISKSTPISGVSEKQRNVFFNKIEAKILSLEKRLRG
jgi:hypothetical protein